MNVTITNTHKLVLQWLNNLLMNPASKPRILDVGCGDGEFTISVKKNFQCEVYALDIPRPESPIWIRKLRKYGVEFYFCDITKEKLPFKNEYFDVITFLDVLEHLITSHPPFQVFKEFNRVLRHNGYLILSIKYTKFSSDTQENIIANWQKSC